MAETHLYFLAGVVFTLTAEAVLIWIVSIFRDINVRETIERNNLVDRLGTTLIGDKEQS